MKIPIKHLDKENPNTLPRNAKMKRNTRDLIQQSPISSNSSALSLTLNRTCVYHI